MAAGYKNKGLALLPTTTIRNWLAKGFPIHLDHTLQSWWDVADCWPLGLQHAHTLPSGLQVLPQKQSDPHE